MLKVVVMPVKNEGWILGTSLACASSWADVIIVADQRSTDETAEICARFPKVRRIENPHPGLHMSKARQLLLEEARKYGVGNCIFAIDADEVLSANLPSDKAFEALLADLPAGHSIELPWVNLWGSASRYRGDAGIFGKTFKHFAFKDDGSANFSDRPTSEPRMPEAYMARSVRYDAVVNLHFQFSDFDRMLSKQRRYRIYDYLASSRTWLSSLKVNLMYHPTRDFLSKETIAVPDAWMGDYAGLLPSVSSRKGVYWYDADSLGKISEFGAGAFSRVDIWDVDWDRLAKIHGVDGDFSDPRTWVERMCHRMMGFFFAINRFVPSWIKSRL